MDFPIVDLLDQEQSREWLERHFHPSGQRCPHCGADENARSYFRMTRRSQLQVYRCQQCAGIYNLYSGTLFAGRHLTPAQVVLLLQGVCQGKSAAQMARELCLSRTTVQEIRRRLQENAEYMQTEERLPDRDTEADELFQNAGEKR